MKSQILLVILAASIFQVAFSACGSTATCGANTFCDRIGLNANAACVSDSAGTCAAGHASTASQSAVTAPPTADCTFCITDFVLNAKTAAATACISTTASASNTCLAGYTDKADGSAASTSGTLGACSYCVTGYTDNTTAGTCDAPAASTIIAYGVMLLAVLFAVLF